MTTSGDSLATVVKGARAEPWTNLYKGVIAFLVLGAKNAVQFAVYEPTKRWQIARNMGGALTPAQAFFHGAFSRLISDAVLFPARRAKVLQQKAKKDGSTTSKSLIGVLAQVAKEKGIVEVFNGLAPELVRPLKYEFTVKSTGIYRNLPCFWTVLVRILQVRGMISGALMLMVKEYIDNIVIGAILGRADVA